MAAEYMLQDVWVDLLVCDAHNLHYRLSRLSDGKQAAAAIIGEDRAHELVFGTLWKIVGGMFASSGYC